MKRVIKYQSEEMMNWNHYTSFRIAVIVSAIVLGFIIGGCAAKPADKPDTLDEWMKVPREVRMADSDYYMFLLRGQYNKESNGALPRAIEVIIKWELGEDSNGVTNARSED